MNAVEANKISGKIGIRRYTAAIFDEVTSRPTNSDQNGQASMPTSNMSTTLNQTVHLHKFRSLGELKRSPVVVKNKEQCVEDQDWKELDIVIYRKKGKSVEIPLLRVYDKGKYLEGTGTFLHPLSLMSKEWYSRCMECHDLENFVRVPSTDVCKPKYFSHYLADDNKLVPNVDKKEQYENFKAEGDIRSAAVVALSQSFGGTWTGFENEARSSPSDPQGRKTSGFLANAAFDSRGSMSVDVQGDFMAWPKGLAGSAEYNLEMEISRDFKEWKVLEQELMKDSGVGALAEVGKFRVHAVNWAKLLMLPYTQSNGASKKTMIQDIDEKAEILLENGETSPIHWVTCEVALNTSQSMHAHLVHASRACEDWINTQGYKWNSETFRYTVLRQSTSTSSTLDESESKAEEAKGDNPNGNKNLESTQSEACDEPNEKYYVMVLYKDPEEELALCKERLKVHQEPDLVKRYTQKIKEIEESIVKPEGWSKEDGAGGKGRKIGLVSSRVPPKWCKYCKDVMVQADTADQDPSIYRLRHCNICDGLKRKMKKKDFWSKPSKDDWAGMAGYSDKKMRNIYLNDNMTAYLNLYKKYDLKVPGIAKYKACQACPLKMAPLQTDTKCAKPDELGKCWSPKCRISVLASGFDATETGAYNSIHSSADSAKYRAFQNFFGILWGNSSPINHPGDLYHALTKLLTEDKLVHNKRINTKQFTKFTIDFTNGRSISDNVEYQKWLETTGTTFEKELLTFATPPYGTPMLGGKRQATIYSLDAAVIEEEFKKIVEKDFGKGKNVDLWKGHPGSEKIEWLDCNLATARKTNKDWEVVTLTKLCGSKLKGAGGQPDEKANPGTGEQTIQSTSSQLAVSMWLLLSLVVAMSGLLESL